MFRGICGALVALLLVRAVPVQAQDQPEWTFTATPYVWAMVASGNVTAKGQTLDVNAGFVDIIGKTDTLVGLTAYFEAQHDKLRLGLDFVFTQMTASPGVAMQRTPVPWLNFTASAGANVKSTLMEIEGSAAYELIQPLGATAVDGLVGVRYWHAVTDMSFGFMATGTIRSPEDVGLFSRSIGIAGASTGSMDWADPILGLQVRHAFGDPSRDLAAVLERALDAEEPGVVGLVDPPGPGARLQDLVTNVPIEVTVHDGFEWWLDDDQDVDPEDDAATEDATVREQASSATAPTARLASVEAAYWVDAGSKEHLRWVLPQDEQVLLDAFARLHAAGEDAIIEGSKLVGMFRAHGLLTPVWDLPPGTGADALEEPAAAFHGRIDAALMVRDDLTSEERAARAMLANHQVTLR